MAASFSPRLVFPITISLWIAQSFSTFLYSQGQLEVGYAILERSGESALPVAAALFSLRSSDGVLIWEAGLAAVEPVAEGRIFVEQANGVSSALALVNTAQHAVSAELVLRNQSGEVEAHSSLCLQSMQSSALFVDELFSGLATPFLGSLTFDASSLDSSGCPSSQAGQLAAVTLRGIASAHPGETVFSTLPVTGLEDGQAAPADSVVFPHIGVGGILTTQIILINRSSQAVSGQVQLWDSAGQPLQADLEGTLLSEFPYNLQADGVRIVTLEGSPDQVKTGFAVVTATQGLLPAGTAIFQFRNPQGGLISEAGVGAIAPTIRARIFVDSDLASGEKVQTGVAIASPNGPARVEFRLLDAQGALLDSRQLEVCDPASCTERGHLAKFADELFPGRLEGQAFSGLLEIESVAAQEGAAPLPVVPITLKLTTNSRNEPILTTLPVADLEQISSAQQLVLPRIGFGEGFSTRLILINRDTSGSSQLTLLSFAPDGSALSFPGRADNEVPFEIGAGGLGLLEPLYASEILIDPAAPDLSEIVVHLGSTAELTPIAFSGGQQVGVEFVFTSLDPQVAQVDSSGLVTGLQPGFSSLTIQSGEAIAVTTITVPEVGTVVPGFSKGLTQDFFGRLYLANDRDHTILLTENLQQAASVWAGSPQSPGPKDGLRLEAQFNSPSFLAFDQNPFQPKLYVSDTLNHAIRLITAGEDGDVRTLQLPNTLNQPQGIALDGTGRLWVADSANHLILRIDLASLEVETIAGSPGNPGSADGTGTQARFDSPSGLAVEVETLAQRSQRADGEERLIRVIVADFGNGSLRRVDESGLVETILGPGQAEPNQQPNRPGWRNAPPFPLLGPVGVASDAMGNLYVSQEEGRQVSILLANGLLVPAAQAGTFSSPQDLAILPPLADPEDPALRRNRVVVADGEFIHEILFGPPRISSVSPSEVDNGGGQMVVVEGFSFAPESIVIILDQVIDTFEEQDSGRLQFTAPVLPSGTHTLTVQTRGGLAQTFIQVQPALTLSQLSAGQITTVVGGTTFVEDGLPASEARLNQPQALAVDSAGDIFIADTLNHRIRRVDSLTGLINTVAGNGVLAFAGDGGPAIAASLCFPQGIALDGRGNLYIADSANHRIRKVDSRSSFITTLAGAEAPLFTSCTNTSGNAGDGGPAAQARFNEPRGIAVDSAGNIYIADALNRLVRRIDAADGIIRTIAGRGCPDPPADCSELVGEGGPALQAGFGEMYGIALDERRNSLYVTDRSNALIRRIDLIEGTVETVAGEVDPERLRGITGFEGDGGPATEARLNRPRGVAVDPSGNLYIADQRNQRIRRVDLEGTISTVAGSGTEGFSEDGSEAMQAALGDPWAVQADDNQNLLIVESSNDRIRQVSAATGRMGTVAGGGSTVPPGLGLITGLALLQEPGQGGGRLFLADQGRNSVFALDVESGGLTLVAGDGPDGPSGDGSALTDARLRAPRDIALDGDGNLYISDRDNHRIRMADLQAGTIGTVAGNGIADFSGDGQAASQASLHSPAGLAFDASGNLWIADFNNHRIRRVDAAGIIQTMAGDGTDESSGDGGPAESASISGPLDLAFDSLGNLYVVDAGIAAASGGDRVRRIDAQSGTISTLAGGGRQDSVFVEGMEATGMHFGTLQAVAIARGADFPENIYIGDLFSLRVFRLNLQQGTLHSVAGTGEFAFGGDNRPATEAGIGFPSALLGDQGGNLFISDILHRRIRAVGGPLP